MLWSWLPLRVPDASIMLPRRYQLHLQTMSQWAEKGKHSFIYSFFHWSKAYPLGVSKLACMSLDINNSQNRCQQGNPRVWEKEKLSDCTTWSQTAPAGLQETGEVKNTWNDVLEMFDMQEESQNVLSILSIEKYYENHCHMKNFSKNSS